jgi:hypothetical protein
MQAQTIWGDRVARRIVGSVLTIAAVLLAVPAIAPAQSTRPAVATGATANLTPQSVSLLGRVRPNGALTAYLFQYGTSTLYGQGTPQASAGSGTRTVNVSAALVGLQPATTYHYRLVARNRNGPVYGADRTFRTPALPLGLSLNATPNPVLFGKPTVLVGALTGTGNANRPVVLQSNPFPYTQGFVTTTNVQLTNAQGAFAFPLLGVPLNTLYRVLIPNRPEIASPIVGVGVRVIVGTKISARRVRKGRRVRFTGTVRPALAGAPVAIQKQRGTNWITVAGTITRPASPNFVRYSKRVRIRRGGNYRVFVAIAAGSFVSNFGRTVRILRIRTR